jgi:hypothetical protein
MVKSKLVEIVDDADRQARAHRPGLGLRDCSRFPVSEFRQARYIEAGRCANLRGAAEGRLPPYLGLLLLRLFVAL